MDWSLTVKQINGKNLPNYEHQMQFQRPDIVKEIIKEEPIGKRPLKRTMLRYGKICI